MGRIIDPSCPVEWSNPLNRGLVAWYGSHGSPGWHAGTRWRDYVRGSRRGSDGTLINGASWVAGPTPGSRSVGLDGGNDYAYIAPAKSWPDIGDAQTLTLWTKHDGSSASGFLFSMALDDTASANNAFGLRLGFKFSLVTVESFTWGASGNGSSVTYLSTDGAANTSTVQANEWFHVAYSCGAGMTGQKWWINGRPAVLFDAVTTSQSGTPTVARVGSFNAAFPTPYHNRPVADLRLYARQVTSDSEVASLYSQSRRGHPDTLRWLSTRRVFAPAGGGGGTFTSTAPLLLQEQNLTASASHSPPAFTSTAGLSVEAMTLVASSTHTTPAFTSTAALLLEAETLNASASHVTTFTSTATLSLQEMTVSSSGDSTTTGFNATAALTIQAQTLAGVGTHATPAFTSTSSLVLQEFTTVAVGVHATPTFVSIAALTLEETTLSGVGVSTTPAFTSSATLMTEVIEFIASTTQTGVQYTATADLSVGEQTLTAVGSFGIPDAVASADLSVASLTFTATAAQTGIRMSQVISWSGRTNLLIEWGTRTETNPPLVTLAWEGRTNLLIDWKGPAQ